jgi:hypothetical protein
VWRSFPGMNTDFHTPTAGIAVSDRATRVSSRGHLEAQTIPKRYSYITITSTGIISVYWTCRIPRDTRGSRHDFERACRPVATRVACALPV